jgi:hypothetical protein
MTETAPPVHRPPNQSRSSSAPVSPTCSGITLKGKRCRNPVNFSLALLDTSPDAGTERFCHHHKNQAVIYSRSDQSLSAPVSPTSSRCSGITLKGKRCKNPVKFSLALLDTNPNAGTERFCHHHKNQAGTYSRNDQSRSSSAPVPPTSYSGEIVIQCSGIAGKPKWCGNKIKTSLALLDTSPDERFCRHHKDQAEMYSESDQSRSLSATVSPTSSSGGIVILCSGIAGKPKWCEIKIKTSLALLDTSPDERFCRHHKDQAEIYSQSDQSRSLSATVSPTLSFGQNRIDITQKGNRFFGAILDAGVKRFGDLKKDLNQLAPSKLTHVLSDRVDFSSS